MTAVVSEIAVRCRSDVHRVWEALADTERTNRILGMSKLALEPIEGASAARYLVRTSLGGLPVEYEERPFEWLYPRRFRILRRMRSGPLDTLDLSFDLAPRADGGTDVKLRLALAPRVRLLAPFVRFMAGVTMRGFEDYIARVDASLAAGREVAIPRRAKAQSAALDRAEKALRAAEPGRAAIVDRLLAHVADADDFEASRIRAFALADAWREDRTAVLGVCLSSVRAGLLDLRWEVVCPSCRTATDVVPTLASLSEHGACQLCDLDFALDLEDAVEATFAPARAVRELDVGPYCIGGPARTPHVLAQSILPARGTATLGAPADEGRYRLFVRGGAAAPVEVIAAAPPEIRIRAEEAGKSGPIAIAPEGSIVVENASPDELHAKLERIEVADQAARARVVTAMPGFRRDFSNDVLRPGLALKIARVGLFFSDLTGSTQLYADNGDAAAFKLVQDHFDVVIGLIEKHGGTLVKTIGDAVMAVFADDMQGLLASIAILHAFEDFRREGGVRLQTHIKLGVFGGSCYAVTANGILDYFGQTVNVAARLQGEAKSGELVVEEALADQAILAKAIPAAFVVERYDARPKGVPEPIRVARIRVAER
ncbi:Adenylate cyclase [Minicystis rosea]|nr:Adenylate cyclase [Minicystis rosea]